MNKKLYSIILEALKKLNYLNSESCAIVAGTIAARVKDPEYLLAVMRILFKNPANITVDRLFF